jgi:hypothetical protein
MTLLVSGLTQDCVWQVADRRLTDIRTRRPISKDTNKAIHFARAMLFAYTGPAELEGTATATWIADRLSAGGDPEESLAALHEGLERAIGRFRRADPLRAFAVDGVGWALDRVTGAIVPRLLRFSNCIDDRGVWTGTLQDEIRVWDGFLKPHAGLNMRAAGQPVPLAIGQRWERQIRRRVAAGAPVADIGRCMVELVRDVAARNTAVGRGVLLSAIPRGAIELPTGITLATMPVPDTATFKYFPEGSLEGIDKGPEIANPRGFRASDFWARTDADGNQIVQVSFRVPDVLGEPSKQSGSAGARERPQPPRSRPPRQGAAR